MPGQEESLGEFLHRKTGVEIPESDWSRQIREKVDEIQRRQQTERVDEAGQLMARAMHIIVTTDLGGLHAKQEAKLTDLHGLREQQAEQARHLDLLELDVDTAKLDALAEMESRPGFTPGKNEEQRKRQRDLWLATHDGYQQAQRIVRSAEATADALELEHHRITDELHSLKSLIGIRIAEMDLISSFVGR